MAAGAGASAYALLRVETPALDPPAVDASALFPAAELERIDSYRTVTRWLWVASTAIELLVLAALAWKGRPLARATARALRLERSAPVRTGVALGALAAACVWVATLPIGATRHWWSRRYGLSEQGYAAWLGDQGLSLLVTTGIVVLAVAGAVFLAVRLGERWWIAGGAALAVLGAVVVLVQPLVIEPLFNRLTPLADRTLAAEVEQLAGSLGVDVEQVEVADASRRTTAANAHVTGIGPTRTVVLYDTLLDGRFSRGEILWVSAHELAHVSRSHVWKGVAWFALFAVPAVGLLAWVVRRRGGMHDPALVPLALLTAFVLFLATLPAQNAISRRYEAEADWLALEATRDAASDVGLQRRFVLTGLGDPDPPGWSRILLGSHPTALERIGMAEAFETLSARGGS